MTKRSGLGQQVYVGGYDLSGDFVSLSKVSTSMAVIEGVTGVDKSAMERLAGKKDGSLDAQTAFNPSAGQQFQVLKGVPRTDTLLTYCMSTTLGDYAACLLSKQVNFDGERDDDGGLFFKISALGSGYGLEWGQMLTAGKRTDTAATNGSSVDTSASLSFGLQAYLQVFAFTGTSVTVKLQDSADNSSWSDITGAAFTAATGITTERIQTGRTQTVRRYVRAVTTGTFSNAIFNVVFVKNPATVNF